MALRRQVKNVVKNFTDIEVKVREATSNDPWGPSSSLTSEIADATYNVQAFSEIMTLLWKRINDHGKNWRHVYKSLVVLDYIVKTGSERVAQQCRENIFAIKTLKDFQFIDKDGKDQGINVREKSKQLVSLLKDDERLKSERQRALKAKERFSQSQGGIGNTSFPKNKKFQGTTKYPESRGSVDDSNIPSQTWQEQERPEDSRSTDGRIDSEIEKVRPSNEVEEEMQLQIALAMSREEAEKDDRNKDGDSQLFNMAVNEGQQQQQAGASTLLHLSEPLPQPQGNTSIFYPWVQPPQPTQTIAHAPQIVNDPWGAPAQSPVNNISITPPSVGNLSAISQSAPDPWGSAPKPADPWSTPTSQPPSQVDPWGAPSQPAPVQDPFAPQAPYDTSGLMFNPQPSSTAPVLFETNDNVMQLSKTEPSTNKSSFLMNGAHLVDVDNILAEPVKQPGSNPFMTSASNTNPFLQDKPKPKSINEMRNDKSNAFASTGPEGDVLLPSPMMPTSSDNQSSSNNPFLQQH